MQHTVKTAAGRLPIKAMPAELRPMIMGISDMAAAVWQSLMPERREAEMPLHSISMLVLENERAGHASRTCTAGTSKVMLPHRWSKCLGGKRLSRRPKKRLEGSSGWEGRRRSCKTGGKGGGVSQRERRAYGERNLLLEAAPG